MQFPLLNISRLLLLVASAFVLSTCTKHEVELEPIPSLEMEVVMAGNFLKLDFGDDNHGIAIRDYEDVFVTTDGGNTWQQTFNVAGFKLEDLCFVTADTAYTLWDEQSGTQMLLYRSTDGGFTWTNLYDFQCTTASINFARGNRGYIFKDNSADEFYKTMDAGLSWTLQSSGTAMKKFAFRNLTIGFAITPYDGMIYTVGGGTTWTPRMSSNQCLDFAVEKVSYDVFAVGTGGKIRSSTNSGYSWTVCFEDASLNILKIDAHSSGLLVAGSRGTFVVSHDLGVHWNYCQFNNVSNMDNIQFYNFQITGPSTILFTCRDGNDNFIGKVTLP